MQTLWRYFLVPVLVASGVPTAGALTVTGYSTAANDRFSSGFPTAPVANGNPAFVGAEWDLSGVGWGTSSSGKGFGFVSPQHYLVARHFGGDPTIRLLDGDGAVLEMTQWKVENTGTGLLLSGQYDLSLGTLQQSIAVDAGIARYAVLDLNASSTVNSSYNGQAATLYGRGESGSSPRVGVTAITGTFVSGVESYVFTDRTEVQFVGGDSGSPGFVEWTNPNGGQELTLIGNNAAIGTNPEGQSFNILNHAGSAVAINALNNLMIDDGRALRVVGNAAAGWVGGSSGPVTQRDDLAKAGNWSGSSIPTDLYVLFDADQTAFEAIDVNAAVNLRGLSFLETAAGSDGFTLAGAGTLTIGRGGVTNYDADRQTITANVALGDHQYWLGGPGGITVANVATGGRLLEIRGGAAAVRITGAISGSGGIALDAGRLELGGVSSYTGTTWVHAGELRVDGNIASSAEVRVAGEGVLSGTGAVGLVTGAGTLAPGAAGEAGILTASQVGLAGGMDFAFEFTLAGMPNFGNAAASGNDVLRLTSATPFAGAFTDANVVAIYLDVSTVNFGDAFAGGFFVAGAWDFGVSLLGATVEYYVADAAGAFSYGGRNYASADGSVGFLMGSMATTADFASGSVAGTVLTISVLNAVPEPELWAALGVGLVLLAGRRGLRRRVQSS